MANMVLPPIFDEVEMADEPHEKPYFENMRGLLIYHVIKSLRAGDREAYIRDDGDRIYRIDGRFDLRKVVDSLVDRQAELKALAEMPDEDIDTSDIPEMPEVPFRRHARFALIWDAIEDDPVECERLKAWSERLMSLKIRRDKAFEELSAVFKEIWGERCEENEAGCACCAAWAIYDCAAKLTDGEMLDDDQ